MSGHGATRPMNEEPGRVLHVVRQHDSGTEAQAGASVPQPRPLQTPIQRVPTRPRSPVIDISDDESGEHGRPPSSNKTDLNAFCSQASCAM